MCGLLRLPQQKGKLETNFNGRNERAAPCSSAEPLSPVTASFLARGDLRVVPESPGI